MPDVRSAPLPALRIHGREYLIRVIAPASGGTLAYRLTKHDGEEYDVSVEPHGAECTCPDFIFRRNWLDILGCKHIRAARAAGLIE